MTTFLLLALDSPFSRPVLQTLLDAGYPPAALILPNPNRTAPPRLYTPTPPPPAPLHLLPSSPSLTQLTALHHIPILTIGSLRHPDAIAALRAFQPDLLLTACFPRLLPPEWLAIPRLGSLNLHPSLLPSYRGPEPLFWQYYHGESHTGVTLHFMDEKADTGDIVAQVEVRFPVGITLSQAETLTAQAGGELIHNALSDPEHLPRTPQPKHGASYHHLPTSSDLIIPTSWTTRRAYNFLRSMRDWGPFEIINSSTSQSLRVQEAVAFVKGGAATPHNPDGEMTWIQFSDGAVRFVLA